MVVKSSFVHLYLLAILIQRCHLVSVRNPIVMITHVRLCNIHSIHNKESLYCQVTHHLHIEMGRAYWNGPCLLKWTLHIEMGPAYWNGPCILKRALHIEMGPVYWNGPCILKWALFSLSSAMIMRHWLVPVTQHISQYSKIQWGAVITRSSLTWYCTQHWSAVSEAEHKSEFELTPLKIPHTSPSQVSYGCLLWGFE